MRTLLVLIFVFMVGSWVQSQENLNLKTIYYVEKCYGPKCLKTSKTIKKTILKKGDEVEGWQKVKIGEVETTIKKKFKVDKDVTTGISNIVLVDEWPLQAKAFVRFKEDKLYVNRYLIFDENGEDEHRDGTYFFKFKNRETISLNHRGVYLSALTIPIKYRPPLTDKEGNKIKEEFVADFNANLFLSTTIWGKTNFTYLKNVDNSIRDHSLRIGGFIGGSSIKLNPGNTENAPNGRALQAGQEITKGLFSFGGGLTYTYNTIGVGAFIGWDLAVGRGSNIWDYDGAPWLGLSLGVDLLKIGRGTN
ncbi:hypothetical protein [Spongiimicrobium sp. 3-5]|uniref:hypothetical protein n=1 Tax=Spongiimicrobium sp. 3-5 TaxID=3332596 RepID=UPI0039800490